MIRPGSAWADRTQHFGPASVRHVGGVEGERPQLPLLVMPTYQQAEVVKESPGQLEAFG